MKKLLLIVLSVVLLTSFGLADETIADIQDTTGTGGTGSRLVGQTVTFSGIISAECYAYDNDFYFVQDGTGQWSGVCIDDAGRENAYGDSVTIMGDVAEAYGKTVITNVSTYTKNSEGHEVQATVVTSGEIGTGGANAEAYEGVLVKVVDVEITNGDAGFGQWKVSDGSGDVMVDDEADYYFWASEYDSCKSVTGPLNYSYSDFKILPRLAFDIVEGNKTGETKVYTRIQRMQQVRHSDLIKAELGGDEDMSYFKDSGDTLNVKGVVTMPTGLSYAGSGIKFILQDSHGGPWSSILSYNSDSTAYPTFFEGDIVEMNGYIDEYSSGVSNMTEFFLTGAVNITDYGQPTPEPDVVTTGDLRLPKTAEQWGNNFVKIKNSIVVEGATTYEVMIIDDGTGRLGVDDDSDSLQNYTAPPLYTPIDSITGWIYHHYGSYADSTTYKIEPLFESDIVLGEGPPTLLDPSATPTPPTSSDSVTVSVTIATPRNITEAKVCYRVDEGAYSAINLTEGASNVWSAKIPPQVNHSFVDYFYSVTDDSGATTTDPADTSLSNKNYIVLNGDPTIHDIQYTHWSAGYSPLEGSVVHITGTVTTNSDPLYSEFDDDYNVLGIQQGSGAWNGIFVIDNATDLTTAFTEGETVEVWGEVTESYSNDYWQWSANTYIALDSIKSTGTGTAVVTEVTVQDLADNPENYEGVLVHISDTVTISAINQYDLTLSDGANTCLLDDDAVPDTVFSITNSTNAIIGADTLLAGNTIQDVTGFFIYSYGSYKLEIRKASDVGLVYTDVKNVNSSLPNTYTLHQNYPNPFNPSTNIAFDLPTASDVTIVIYNVRGQMVKVLTREQFQAGNHILHWNGINRYGQRVSTGVYIYRIMANDFVDVKKMVYLK